MPQYKRPPITEAVIEIRFEDAIEAELVDKFEARLRSEGEYLLSDRQNTMNLMFDVQHQSAQVSQQAVGYRLSSLDRTDVVVASTHVVATSRLAPYTRWEVFRARATKNWELWRRIVGYRKVNRLGVRYINRLDIPLPEGAGVRLEEYLRIYPEIPEGTFPAMVAFTMQCVLPLGEDSCLAVLNIAPIPSPLLNYGSFLFDIDVYRDADVPQKDEDLWALIDRIRGYKNRIFESGITDKTRGLFE